MAASVLIARDGHDTQTNQLTGPAPLTPRNQAEVTSATIGEPVVFEELTRASARDRMVTMMPGYIADATLDILGSPTPEEQQVGSAIEEVLGRLPGNYASWVDRFVDSFL